MFSCLALTGVINFFYFHYAIGRRERKIKVSG